MIEHIVALTTATLDSKAGHTACESAIATAGVGVRSFVSIDPVGQGGAKTANAGLRWALGTRLPYVCYINDDVEFAQQDWLKRLIEALEENPRYSTAAPGGHCATAPQCKATPGMARGMQVVKHLSHFCVVHKREALADIGIFDEAFFHYGCDNDWNLRAAQKGWKLVWVKDVWVNHFGCHPGRRMTDWMKHDQALYKKRLREGYYK
jgi:GT2 family glycosyltransferase